MTADMIGYLGTGLAALLIMIANWIIFQKAGRPGWLTLIPIYNVYAEYKICWKGWIGIFSLILAAGIGYLASQGVEPVMLAVPAIVLVLIEIKFCFKLAKAFGRGFFMGLLLVITAGLGRIILGFGGSRYVGKTA